MIFAYTWPFFTSYEKKLQINDAYTSFFIFFFLRRSSRCNSLFSMKCVTFPVHNQFFISFSYVVRLHCTIFSIFIYTWFGFRFSFPWRQRENEKKQQQQYIREIEDFALYKWLVIQSNNSKMQIDFDFISLQRTSYMWHFKNFQNGRRWASLLVPHWRCNLHDEISAKFKPIWRSLQVGSVFSLWGDFIDKNHIFT